MNSLFGIQEIIPLVDMCPLGTVQKLIESKIHWRKSDFVATRTRNIQKQTETEQSLEQNEKKYRKKYCVV